MSTVVFHRPARATGPELPTSEIILQEPPELPAPKKANFIYLIYMLPMMMGFSLSGLVAFRPGGSGSLLSLLGPGMMGLSMVGMGFMMAGRNQGGNDSTPTDRRDYLRYLAITRAEVNGAMEQQREASFWQHPGPDDLRGLVDDDRMWERRVDDVDFCRIRIGLGRQRVAITLTPPQTRPVEDLEPLSAISLRRFIEAHQTIEDLPISVALNRFSKVLLRGDGDAIDAMVRAMICQIAVLHSPDDARIVICAATDRQPAWEWTKWLPHVQHPIDTDAAGTARLFYESVDDVEALLGIHQGLDVPVFEPDAKQKEGEVATVIILDGVTVGQSSPLSSSGVAATSIVDVGGTFRPVTPDGALSLEVSDGRLRRHRDEGTTELGRPDGLTTAEARQLAKLLAGFEPASTSSEADDSHLRQSLELPDLLRIGDSRNFDPTVTQRRSVTGDHLEVALGVGATGRPLTLNLREGAQGGSGPHGMLVGATGSGKSELLRTLVLSLAATHSSEILNLVLVDFKGGATFLGCERLPHASAIITNLADELTLVDRMQDAIHGELVRRQEELRSAGYASVLDYERARAAGADLEPMPSLLLIIDEFSELLSAKREFSDLFVMVGRLGRSLGVHLLLATQRLDEGRVNELLSHLSYRIGLRMFSSSESRSVLGTTAAYEDDLEAGAGYIRADNNLERFKAAYVSAPVKVQGPAETAAPAPARPDLAVLPFTHGYLAPRSTPSDPMETMNGSAQNGSATDEEESDGATVYTSMLDRLSNVGPPARKIWLAPLSDAPPLSDLMPPPALSADNGLQPVQYYGLLRTPAGIVDNPFEQRYDVLLAELGGAGGHVAVAGAPQSGKSTLLATLMAGLGVSHRPDQVQFYCLDFGGGALGALRRLPHVGGVVSRQDKEGVARTVLEIVELLDRRETLFESAELASIDEYRELRAQGRFADDPFADDVFLVIDGWETFHKDFPDVEDHLPQLVSSGLAFGIHVVATANRWNEFRPWFRDNAGTRFELRMGDRIDSLVDTRAAASVPKVPGRGLAEGGRHYLTALPTMAGIDGHPDAGRSLDGLVEAMAHHWSEQAAPAVRRLPATVARASLPPPEGGESKTADLRVPLGIEGEQMETAWIDLGVHPHLLVVGDAGSGKTNALSLVTRAITESVPADVGQIVLADYRRGLYSLVPEELRLAFAVSGAALKGMADDLVQALIGRLPDAEISPEQLTDRDWWSGKKVYVIVDDYDLLTSSTDSPLAPFADLLSSGPEIGFHMVIARSASGINRAMMDPVWRRLVELNTPMLLLSCPKDEGMINGVRAERHPVGRGRLLHGRSSPLVQLATAEEVERT